MQPWMIERFFNAGASEQRAWLAMLIPGLWESPPAERRARLRDLFAGIDLTPYRNAISEQLIASTRLDEVIPAAYADYRPIVADGLRFWFAELERDRLIEICIDQLELSPSAVAEERLLLLVDRIPTLYKLGQIIARNRHVDSEWRRWLGRLECSRAPAADAVTETAVAATLAELAPAVRPCLEPVPLAQASVGVVFAGTLADPPSSAADHSPCPLANERNGGAKTVGRQVVVKLLRPHLRQYLAEELRLLERLGAWLALRSDRYRPQIDFLGLFSDLRDALHNEADLRREQRNLRLAARFYAGHRQVQVPQVLGGSESATVMSRLSGEALDDCRMTACQRRRLARDLFRVLIVEPLLGNDGAAIVHGDPHAGNLLFELPPGSTEGGCRPVRIGLLDWSQAEPLAPEVRIRLRALVVAIRCRDAAAVREEVAGLAIDSPGRSDTDALIGALLERSRFSHGSLVHRTFAIIDALVESGLRFPLPLMLLRKAVFTVDGICRSLDARFDPDAAMADHLAAEVAVELPWRLLGALMPWSDRRSNYASGLSNRDLSAVTRWEWFDRCWRLMGIREQAEVG